MYSKLNIIMRPYICNALNVHSKMKFINVKIMVQNISYYEKKKEFQFRRRK